LLEDATERRKKRNEDQEENEKALNV